MSSDTVTMSDRRRRRSTPRCVHCQSPVTAGTDVCQRCARREELGGGEGSFRDEASRRSRSRSPIDRREDSANISATVDADGAVDVAVNDAVVDAAVVSAVDGDYSEDSSSSEASDSSDERFELQIHMQEIPDVPEFLRPLEQIPQEPHVPQIQQLPHMPVPHLSHMPQFLQNLSDVLINTTTRVLDRLGHLVEDEADVIDVVYDDGSDSNDSEPESNVSDSEIRIPDHNAVRPVSFGDMVRDMPTVTVNSSSLGSRCGICIEDFEEGEDAIQLSCSHLHHRECFLQWVDRNKRTCPICRRDVMSDVMHGAERGSVDRPIIL